MAGLRTQRRSIVVGVANFVPTFKRMVSYRFRNKRMRLKTRAYGIRFSCFSVCNIEKAGNGPEDEANMHVYTCCIYTV